jgi:hypothetical protein
MSNREQIQSFFPKTIKFLLVLLTGGGLQRIQWSYKSHLHELPPIQKIRVYLQVTLVKAPCLHYEYYFNLESPRSKHSKESRKLKVQYEQDAYLNQKSITREISEASSSRTWFRQSITVERAPTGRNSSKTLLSHSLYL